MHANLKAKIFEYYSGVNMRLFHEKKPEANNLVLLSHSGYPHRSYTETVSINFYPIIHIKGTVARDFWPLVYFMNRPHMDA
jgi:hypothetical protein